jgi:hypothetical protein
MQAHHSLYHSVSRSNPAPFSFDRFCLDCDAFVALNTRGRCDVCDSNAVSVSPLSSSTDHKLHKLLAVVRESRGAA